LESAVEDAGTNDTCPQCAAAFVVPGRMELDAARELDRKKATAAEDRARAALERNRVEKERAAADKRFEDEGLGEKYDEQRRATDLAKQRQQGIWAINADGKTVFCPGVDENGPQAPAWRPFNAAGHWEMSHDVLAGYWR
jgi:hypothetical protein